jgi:acetyl esterase/lipase
VAGASKKAVKKRGLTCLGGSDTFRFMPNKFCCALLFLTSAVLAQQPVDPRFPNEWPETKLVINYNVEYARAGDKSLTLDLYRPQKTKKPLPVLVWIHGQEGRFAGKYPCPIASMVGNDYAVASIDYRSASEAKFPGQIEDCKAAVRWLRANAAKYNLDTNNIGAWGWSEGGCLAVLLGTSGGVKEFEGTGGNTDQSSQVQAVVDFDGMANLGNATPENPVRYASSSAPPVLILQERNLKGASSSRHLDAALRKAGVKSTLSEVKGAGHEFKQLRQGEQVDLVNQFLDEHLKGGEHVRFMLLKIDPPDDAWVDPIIDEPAGTKYELFSAPSLGAGGQASCLVYLPPDYEKSSGQRYPVIYYLHGGGGNQRVCDGWVQKLDAAIRAGTIPPMIAVSVEGLPNGRYLDSPDGKTPIESVIIKDLIPHIDATYRTIPRREARVMEGLSMGGYGVFHLGFKYPEMFGMISGMCNGVPPPGKKYDGTDAPAESPSDLAADPYTLAEKNLAAIKGRMPIRMIVGTEDFTLAANEAFHTYLLKIGIAHDYRVVPGISHGYKPYYEFLDFSFFKTVATQ